MQFTEEEYAQLKNALLSALAALNMAPRCDVGLTDSYKIANQCERAITLLEKMEDKK